MLYYTDNLKSAVYAIDNIDELAFLPDGLVAIAESDVANIVDGLKPLSTADDARFIRNEKLHCTQWVVQRHRDEIESGRETTLSDMQYAETQAYRQALRDIPSQDGFPQSVSWPVKPEFLNY